MAKQQGERRKNGAALTEYIVLERIDAGDAKAWAPVLNDTAAEGPDLKPRVFLAASKQAAIRQHTGDGPDVLEGTWKAVPLSSWKGGEVTKRVTAAAREAVAD